LHEKVIHVVDSHKNYHAYRSVLKKRYDKLPNFWDTNKEEKKKGKGCPLIPFLGMMTR